MLARSADPVHEKKNGFSESERYEKVHEKAYERVRDFFDFRYEKVYENCMKKIPGFFERIW